jgi:hypothetical protein
VRIRAPAPQLIRGVRPTVAMAFLRFVVATRDPDSGVEEGLFRAAYTLRRSKNTTADHRRALAELLSWFDSHLPTPKRFNRTSSKGFYRRNARGIAWFRDSAHEHLLRMHQLRGILQSCGYSVEMIREDRIGYIVYEDAVQVVAEPFSDTRTGTGR